MKEFKYLGAMLCEGGESSRDVQERVKAGWRKWGEVSAVMNDKRMGMRLKAKVYRLVVQPVLTYGAECWALNKRDEKRLEVTEMNMLRRMLGVTRRDKLRNEEVRERTGMQENIVIVERSKIRWYGHVRKGERDVVRRAMDCPVMGKRQPRRWKDWVEVRMKELGVGSEDVLDRKRWRGIVAADPSGEGRG